MNLDESSTSAKTLSLLLGINLQVNFAYLNRDISEKDIKVLIGKSLDISFILDQEKGTAANRTRDKMD